MVIVDTSTGDPTSEKHAKTVICSSVHVHGAILEPVIIPKVRHMVFDITIYMIYFKRWLRAAAGGHISALEELMISPNSSACRPQFLV